MLQNIAAPSNSIFLTKLLLKGNQITVLFKKHSLVSEVSAICRYVQLYACI